MTPLDLESEAVRPTGNIVSEGVLNQLGRPRMDRLTVLLREAGQNSLDAAAPDRATVDVGVSLRSMTGAELSFLRSNVFPSIPPYLSLGPLLYQALPEGMTILTIADRGTTGLGGPTRADSMDESQGRDFVDFLRNVGQPPGRTHAGGTYGYGKASFFLASGAHTILVHSRCLYGGVIESRFMAAALGEDFVDHHGRFTGRHWWGRWSDDLVEPLVNQEADEVASALGLPGFDPMDLGTTIVVLDPLLDESKRKATDHIAEAILLHFWPKILSERHGMAGMRFSLECDGEDIAIPDPDAFAPLQGFAAAWRRLHDLPEAVSIESRVLDIESLRPRAHLGKLALVKFGAARRLSRESRASELRDAEPILTASHHVALMRSPELVVDYLPGPSLGTSVVEYAGVFKADPAVEQAFADSEPPTHDDWQPQNLSDDWHRRYVRVALRRVRECMEDFVIHATVVEGGMAGLPLGSFADQLGSLLIGVAGRGGSITRGRESPATSGSAANRARQPKPKLEVVGSGALEEFEGRTALAVTFRVLAAPSAAASVVTARPAVVLDGGTLESDPPIDSGTPEILAWRSPDGVLLESASLTLPAADQGDWSVIVALPTDAVVAVSLDAEASA